MVVRSCRFLVAVVAVAALFFVLVGCPTGVVGGIQAFVGVWDLTLRDANNNVVGTGTFEVTSAGSVSGSATVDLDAAAAAARQVEATISGTVQPTGAISGSLSDASGNTLATFTGNLRGNAGQGTWTKAGEVARNPWTATRRQATPTPTAAAGTPTPQATPTPTPQATPSPTPAPQPTPTPTPTPPPVLSVAPSSLELTSLAPSGTVTVSNTGQSTLEWQASTDQTWLGVSPASGQLAAGGEATVTISANTTGLLAGQYEATVSFTSNGGDAQVTVALTVTETNIIIQQAGVDHE